MPWSYDEESGVEDYICKSLPGVEENHCTENDDCQAPNLDRACVEGRCVGVPATNGVHRCDTDYDCGARKQCTSLGECVLNPAALPGSTNECESFEDCVVPPDGMIGLSGRREIAPQPPLNHPPHRPLSALTSLDKLPAPQLVFGTNRELVIDFFQDLKCGMCGRAWQNLGAEFIDLVARGEIQLRIWDLSLLHSEEDLKQAAKLRCALGEGKYLDILTRFYERRGQISDGELLDIATTLGLRRKSFERCIRDLPHLNAVKADSVRASELGIEGTPTFYANGFELRGAFVSVDDFRKHIRRGSSTTPPVSE